MEIESILALWGGTRPLLPAPYHLSWLWDSELKNIWKTTLCNVILFPVLFLRPLCLKRFICSSKLVWWCRLLEVHHDNRASTPGELCPRWAMSHALCCWWRAELWVHRAILYLPEPFVHGNHAIFRAEVGETVSPYVILIPYEHHWEQKRFTRVSEEPPFVLSVFPHSLLFS